MILNIVSREKKGKKRRERERERRREKERRGRFIYFGFPQRSNQMVISKLGGNIVLVLLLILIALGLLTLDRCIINYRKFNVSK